MSFSVLWIALPKERAGNRARLSLVASPRIEQPITKFGANELADWPAIVRALSFKVATQGSTELRAATVISAAPSSALWKALFKPTTPVGTTRGGGRAAVAAAQPGPVFAQAATGLETLYRQAHATRPMDRSHPVAQTLAALTDPRVTAVKGTPDDVGRAQADLGGALATAVPIAAYARSLRDASLQQNAPGPLDAIRPIHQAEFHQVMTMVLDHPTLALALGLRVDIEFEAFDGPRVIRAVGGDGQPLNGTVSKPQPWTSVAANFTVASRAGDETADGQLDLRSGFVATTTDVAALATQLPGLLDGKETVTLPVRRAAGITVAQRNRADRAAKRFDRAKAIEAPGQEPVLFADDVTTGYRVDVARNRGPFRSLMRRTARYTLGSEVLNAADEGKVEALVGTQQLDRKGIPRFAIGEEVIGWNGWSAVAAKPGPKVDGPGHVTEIEPGLVPGYDLRVDIAAAESSLPRLRYGSEYELRARIVDLAGNSVAAAADDRSRALAPLKYLRPEAAPSPALMPRRRFTEAESLHTLVVRGDGKTCERHLVPPKASFDLCERHGLFDAAFGPRATQDVRDRLLALAARESGTLLDQGPGHAVVTNDPTQTPKLPTARGDALPNGAYVIRDVDAITTPYLADPIVAGVALQGLPGGTVTAAFGGTWPDLIPIRLVLEAGPTAQARVTGTVLRVQIPPGFDAELTLSCTIAEARLSELDLGNATRDEVLGGRALALSAPQPLRVVHAVREPLAAPAIEDFELRSDPGRATADVRALVACDVATTGRVDLEASWTEVTDTGTGPIDTGDLRVTAASELVTESPVKLAATQHFGDRRHRELRYTAVAATRYREYFRPGDAGTRPAEAPVTVHIPNRIKPTRPDVDAVVPTFRWTRKTENGVVTSVRETAGLRLWLKRKWMISGTGELLGVVLGAGDQGSRYGSDPLEETVPAPAGQLTAERFPNAVRSDVLPLGNGETARIVGHEVRFDAQRGLWYADVDLDLPELAWPFVRLAVVRYQPESLAGCHLSPVVVTDFAQLPPRRAISARRAGQFGVRVSVRGPAQRQSRFVLRQERRIPEPLVTSLDLGSDDGVGAANGWQSFADPPRDGALAEVVLDWMNSGAPPAAVVNELKAGRVVIEERQPGWALLGPDADERVTYTETFDRAAVGMGS